MFLLNTVTNNNSTILLK